MNEPPAPRHNATAGPPSLEHATLASTWILAWSGGGAFGQVAMFVGIVCIDVLVTGTILRLAMDLFIN